MTNSIETLTVELRSDTFTKPSKGMYEAMLNAEVGDSHYDEDPTMTQLETEVAKLFGKEAALFLPSGTMSNLVGLMVHCFERGSEIIIGRKSHINLWEQGSVSSIGNIYAKQLENLDDGTFDLDTLEYILCDGIDRGKPKTKVICLENTHNFCGGRILPLDFIQKVRSLCDKHDIKMHLDGSRIVNAAVALNMSVKDLCKDMDSINFCFSKGIGAPIGSILVGNTEFIEKAIRVRQSLGGGLRQSGILAAACLFGLSQMNEVIKTDNENAKKIAEGIAKVGHGVISVNLKQVQTNIILIHILEKSINVTDFQNRMTTVPKEELNELKKNIIVKMSDIDTRTLRLVTHLDFHSNQIDSTILKFDYVCREFATEN